MTSATRRWGPDLRNPDITVFRVPAHPGGLTPVLDAVSALRDALGIPFQVVRADRVLGRTHLVMAATHAARALATGRARADDPAVEFLLYAAAHRQIQHALRIMGLPRVGTAGLLVALAPVDAARCQDAARGAEVELAPVDLSTEDEPLPPTAGTVRDWAVRLGLPVAERAGPDEVEDALLAAMAGLAVARA